jgi:hypothetical protein
MKKEIYPSDWPCIYCWKVLAAHTKYRNCITEGVLLGGCQWTPMGNLEYLERQVDKNKNTRKV